MPIMLENKTKDQKILLKIDEVVEDVQTRLQPWAVVVSKKVVMDSVREVNLGMVQNFEY